MTILWGNSTPPPLFLSLYIHEIGAIQPIMVISSDIYNPAPQHLLHLQLRNVRISFKTKHCCVLLCMLHSEDWNVHFKSEDQFRMGSWGVKTCF